MANIVDLEAPDGLNLDPMIDLEKESSPPAMPATSRLAIRAATWEQSNVK
jgi:hypothetical protein